MTHYILNSFTALSFLFIGIEGCSFFSHPQLEEIHSIKNLTDVNELKQAGKVCIYPLNKIQINELKPCDSCMGLSSDHIFFDFNGHLRNTLDSLKTPDQSLFWLSEEMGDIPNLNGVFDTKMQNLIQKMSLSHYNDSNLLWQEELGQLNESLNCNLLWIPFSYVADFSADHQNSPHGMRKQTLNIGIWSFWSDKLIYNIHFSLTEKNLKAIDRDFSSPLIQELKIRYRTLIKETKSKVN